MPDRLHLLAIVATLLLFPSWTDASTLVKIAPSSVSAGIGDTVVVEVLVEEVDALFGVNVDLRCDPLLVEGLSLQEGAFLQSGAQTSFLSHVDHAAGLVNFGATRLGEAGGVSGFGTLAEIRFRTRTAGSTLLFLDVVQLFRYPALDEIPHTVEHGEIVVSGANRAPELSTIPDTTAVQNIPFEMQIQATDRDGDTLVFTDDTDLFDISATGLIRFTPDSTDVGSHTITVTVTDDSAASDSDAFVLTVWPRPQIAINEVLCDPPSGSEGDANRDGVRSGSEDEFVELLNIGSNVVDLSGWTLSDGASSPFAFPSGTWIAPGEYIVLFGGGTPTGFSGQVFTDDGTIGGGLSNSGDSVYLINPAGSDTIAALTYADWGTNQSYTRVPEGTGDFVPHTSLPGRGRFSPGAVRPVLTSITVLPAGVVIAVGGKEQFTALGIFSDGGTEDITAQVSWSTSDGSVAAVTSEGLVYAEGPGSTDVQATFRSITGSETVTVEPPPAPPPTYPPVLSDIPDQNIQEGERFSNIFLDLYVRDEDDEDSELTWTYSGNRALSVSVSSGRVATLTVPSADWNGSETITFTVTDPDGKSVGDAMTATVSGVNDPPVLEAIPDTTTRVGRWFRLQLHAADPDVVYGDILSYVDDTELFDVSEAGWIAFKPEEADVGTHTVTVTVTDKSLTSDRRTFALTILARPRIVINEVLCDPPSDGDANRDGIVDPYQDEFVELLNVGSESVDMGHWRLSDDDVAAASQFAFPPGTHIAPGEYVVLFGGGTPAGFAGQVFVDDGKIGNGLTNRGDVVRLIAPDGPDTIAVLNYSDWGADQSFVRWPEGSGDFVPHVSVDVRAARYSPGTSVTALTAIAVMPSDTIVALGKTMSFIALGTYSDGRVDTITAFVLWTSSDTTTAVVDSAGLVTGRRAGTTRIVAEGFGTSGYAILTTFLDNRPPRLEVLSDATAMVGRLFRLRVRALDPDSVYGDVLSYADDTDLFDVSETGWIAFEPEAVDVGTHTITITVSDDSAASASVSFVLTVLPRPRIVINEVLCDPPPGSEGDANRDGVRSGSEDEFVEILNIGSYAVDLSGWTLSDGTLSPFVFPSGTWVAPGEYIVLFGGGTPMGFSGQVFADDGTLGGGLSNSGDSVVLVNPAGPDTIAALTYADWGTDRSYTRHPEGTGDFVPHSSLPGKGRFSPGTARTVLTSIAVTPEDTTVVLGHVLSFSAIGSFSDGSTQDLTSEVRWSSSDSTVALVDAVGLVTATSAGTTQIRATFGAVESAPLTLTVVWPPPVADFAASPTEGIETLTVGFTDQSVGFVHEVLWDFGDGSSADTTRSPSHTYKVGTFTVGLTVSGPGGMDTETKVDLITVLPEPEELPPEKEPPPSEEAPQADFVVSDTLGVGSLTVVFEDRTVGVVSHYVWDFGDGSPADTTRSPSHTYKVGTFTVGLTVSGPGGMDTETKADLITVLPEPEEPPPEEEPPEEPLPSEEAPQADFVVSDTLGVGSLTVVFEDCTVGVVTHYVWDFGDGSPADTTGHPSHTYSVGTFSVSLTVTGPGGMDTETKTDFITVLPKPEEPPYEEAPQADFVASDTAGVEVLTVVFEDRTVGVVTHYVWDFGDGSPVDTTRNPSHTYKVGTFTVSLTVTGPGGMDTETKTDFITVLPKPEEPPYEEAPQADFVASDTAGVEVLTVVFEDRTVGVVSHYVWDFGDGSPADTTRNPSHTYKVGTFTVSLTVIGPGGMDTETKTDLITVLPKPEEPPPEEGPPPSEEAPQADFVVSDTLGVGSLTVVFEDRTVGVVTHYVWDFGDGSTADTTRNPSHTYKVGTFTVSLTVIGPGGMDTETKTDLITVLPRPEEPPPEEEPPPSEEVPQADFVASDTVGVGSLTVVFEDRTVGMVTHYVWDFGDGSPADTTWNPSHTYKVGTFTVSLTVIGPGGSDTVVKADYIVIESEPQPLVNRPPIVADIPDQTAAYGSPFAPFDLDDYVTDVEDSDAEIGWTFSGSVHVSVEIGEDHIVRLMPVSDDWVGSEIIAFTATDPGGLFAADSVRATILAPEIPKGDVNGDGVVDSTDVARMADFILGYAPFTDRQRSSGDVNDDGRIDLLDILEAIRLIREEEARR